MDNSEAGKHKILYDGLGNILDLLWSSINSSLCKKISTFIVVDVSVCISQVIHCKPSLSVVLHKERGPIVAFSSVPLIFAFIHSVLCVGSPLADFLR
jgi:hypothetical protein